jgi:hypothetical protein
MDNALVRADVRDLPAMEAGLDGGYDAIVHLAAHAGERIPMYGDGSTCRDYTYVAGVMAALAYDRSRYEVINLGNDRTITLRAMIDELERVLNVRAEIEQLPDQPGDIPQTWASIDKARAPDVGLFMVTYANGMMASMAGFVVGGAFITLAVNDITWYSFALLAALDLISKRQLADAVRDAEQRPDESRASTVQSAVA